MGHLKQVDWMLHTLFIQSIHLAHVKDKKIYNQHYSSIFQLKLWPEYFLHNIRVMLSCWCPQCPLIGKGMEMWVTWRISNLKAGRLIQEVYLESRYSSVWRLNLFIWKKKQDVKRMEESHHFLTGDAAIQPISMTPPSPPKHWCLKIFKNDRVT